MHDKSTALRALSSLAVVLCGALTGARAHASDEDSAPQVVVEGPRSRAEAPRLRRLVLLGDAAEARSAIRERLVEEASVEERAALLELLRVCEVWGDRGGPPSVRVKDVAPPNDRSAAFEIARSELLRGAYIAASRHLGPIVDHEQDPVEAARAAELDALAKEALVSLPTAGDATSGASSARAPTTRDASAGRDGSPENASWYGWQTLITDGAALLAAPIAPAAGVGLYLVGAPLVHATHGRFGTAAGSFGLRLGAPLVGGVTGIVLWGLGSDCGFDGPELCGLGSVLYGAVGAGLGVITAVTLDASLLAREPAPPQAKRTSAISFRPSASPRRDGGLDVGLGGTW